MPDRTQTLTVEIDGLERLADDLGGDPKVALLASVGRLRSLLSQPEHQGDEAAERIVARIVSHWLINRGAEIRAGQPLTGTPNGIAREILAALSPQPPAPVLSDEQRRQLRKIAASINEKIGHPDGTSDADFLRNLASQEHRGEEKGAQETAWEESGRSALDEMFEALTPRDGSEGDLYTAAMLAPHAWAEIKRLRSHPPAGEVERLRELIAVEIDWLRQGPPELRLAVVTAGRLQAALDATSPPPSDSQEDQELVAKNFGIDSPGRPEVVPRPDCNPAPTKCPTCEREDRDASPGLCTDLWHYEDPAPTQQDEFEEPPEDLYREVPDPAPTQVEGDGDVGDYGVENPGTVDWPEELTVGRTEDGGCTYFIPESGGTRFPSRRYLPATSQDSSGLETEEDRHRRVRAVVESLYPHLETNTTEMLAHAAAMCEREEGRASKAEAERDRWMARCDEAAADHLAAQKALERAETALEEAEDRFVSCDHCERPSREEDLATIWCQEPESSEQVDARICLVCRYENALEELASELEKPLPPHDDALELRSGTLLDAASLARKTAAKLKEGER